MRWARATHRIERRLVWILGSPRTGSTWLLNLLRSARGVVGIDEPSIGAHLALTTSSLLGLRPSRVPTDKLRLNDMRSGADDYFFCERYEPVWRPLLRELILGRLAVQAADLGKGGRLPLVVLKEPHGSVGGDVLMSTVPRSRLLFLLRDGRDVIDSELDAARSHTWAAKQLAGYLPADADRLAYITERAHAWLARTAAVRQAYDAHDPSLRMLVRYEDLVADTVPVLGAVFRWLGVSLPVDEVRGITQSLAFDRLNAQERGPGRFHRAASPGLWRENFTDGEQREVHEVLGPTLRELGYE